MFCHSPETWKELWDGQVFEKGTVKVETELRAVPEELMRKTLGLGPETPRYLMTYSIMRL